LHFACVIFCFKKNKRPLKKRASSNFGFLQRGNADGTALRAPVVREVASVQCSRPNNGSLLRDAQARGDGQRQKQALRARRVRESQTGL
jgi:hypothetical protein